MNSTDRPIAHPQAVLHDEFDDWAILFQPLTGEAVGVGPVGVEIWKLLDGRRTLAEIAAEIAALCAEPQKAVLADTLTFLNDLERRLLVLTEPPVQPAPPPRIAPLPAPDARPARGPGDALSLADGTRLALHAADEAAARRGLPGRQSAPVARASSAAAGHAPAGGRNRCCPRRRRPPANHEPCVRRAGRRYLRVGAPGRAAAPPPPARPRRARRG
jgi:hypothetical protein